MTAGDALGRLFGVLALSSFLAAAMLAARVPGLDRWFGGLVRIWFVHRLLGFAAFILIMLHVLLLVFAALPLSVEAGIERIFPAQWETWIGWAGFVVMAVFVAPTFGVFGKPHYQRWKRLHSISGLALLLVVFHGLAFTATPLLWWVLTIAAVAAVVWRQALAPILARRPYTVERVERLARDVVELSLRPGRDALTWRAGQFVYLTPLDRRLKAGYREEHPYTVSSSPSQPVMRIGIKAVGDATEALKDIAPGADVQIEGPYGAFLEPDAPELKRLWLGGGIGITPFVAGARFIQEKGAADVDTVLVYLANRPERGYYLGELERIADDCAGFSVFPHYLSEQGVITRDYLAEKCPDFASREVFLCGPPGMVAHLRALLKHEGMPGRRIHTEAFDFL